MANWKLVICQPAVIPERAIRFGSEHFALHVATADSLGTIDFRRFTGLAGLSLKASGPINATFIDAWLHYLWRIEKKLTVINQNGKTTYATRR